MIKRTLTDDTALVKSKEMTGRAPEHCGDGSGKKGVKTTEKIGHKYVYCIGGTSNNTPPFYHPNGALNFMSAFAIALLTGNIFEVLS
jgi:hypothetical protein